MQKYVQDDPVVGRIGTVPVRLPLLFVQVKLYIAPEQGAVCKAKRTHPEIRPVSGIVRSGVFYPKCLTAERVMPLPAKGQRFPQLLKPVFFHRK